VARAPPPATSNARMNLMHSARISELLAPYLNSSVVPSSAVLTPAQLNDISTYIDLLIHWNARINLTAIRTEEEIVTRHFGESLFAAIQLFPAPTAVSSVFEDLDLDNDSDRSSVPPGPARESPNFSRAARPEKEIGASAPRPPTRNLQPVLRNRISVADLGSGAGFPGIPLKLWAPEIHLTLIESNQKKSTFLRELVRSLTLANIDIKTARAETTSETYDLLTLRAVERFTSILPVAASLTKPAGRLALLISSAQLDEARRVLHSFSWQAPILIPNSLSRHILIGFRG
jgi:16S rRNA (guanine(527)-N(7))-methyltransferase RsmG